MAGIGFVLQKVLKKGSFSSFVKVAFSGAMIVAGPWLLSIVAITLINRLAAGAISESPMLFTGVIVYSFAFSLCLYSGVHFLFTRIMADYIFLEKEREASALLVVVLMIVIMTSAAISCGAYSFLDSTVVEHAGLFVFSCVLLFCAINCIWLLMLFITLLEHYILIVVIYGIGQVAALSGVLLLAPVFGLAGAVLGFAIGQVLTVLLFVVLALTEYPPRFSDNPFRVFADYFKKHYPLFLTGFFYYSALWIDKFLYWIYKGEDVPGIFFRLYSSLDVAVYISTLSIIPGLVYFVIFAETDFYVLLRRFITVLVSGRFSEIQKAKYDMNKGMKARMLDQAHIQLVVTIVLIIAAGLLNTHVLNNQSTPLIFITVLIGMFFNLMFLVIMNFNFYMEFYGFTLTGSLLYVGLNALFSLIDIHLGLGLPGLGFTLAGIISSVYLFVNIDSASKKLDRLLLSRY